MIHIKKYTVIRTFQRDTDVNNAVNVHIDVDAQEIIGIIPVVICGKVTGIFQCSVRVPFIFENSFTIQVVPTVTQEYKLDVFVFWR